MQRYSDLHALIRSDDSAGRFYRDLPADIKDVLRQQADNIHSISNLQEYAKNRMEAAKWLG